MAADPAEGLDADGFITTGARIANVRAPYDAVLADVRTTIRAALGTELHGLYLYGSVATGQAVPPASDLDLAAVVIGPDALETCRLLGEELSARHRSVVREVGVSPVQLEKLLAEDDAGRAERCFLKHYCVGVAGIDLRPDLPRCRPDRAIAREFVGELAPKLRHFTERLEAAATPAEVEAVAVLVARRLLMAAAVVYSIPDRTWTTARTDGAEMLGRHHPALAGHAARALAWIGPHNDEGPGHVTPTREEVGVVLGELGALLTRDVQRYLGPEG
ncbi:nucleotidyltransferase domain-containing protein [Actinopolymorpha rutila]|uniref:Putative nucleotidyltransferase n=1 Tax=Actinopolymorpha rutila TaxID=446787 RepID=A0A852ZPD6_9ACTN|nr:nucleotidyltransferase domain-containing protein [Actinopolymorpha rutila]NYH93412.1 putative nucleotidyltransferase [Actinopolymorpha rutila]